MKQISYGQLIMLLFITRFFKTMTYNHFEYVSAINILIELLISVAIQSLILIPFIYIYKKYPGDDVFSLAYNKNKILGHIISALYILYFSIIVFRAVKYFAVFMSHMFGSLHYTKAITIILILAGLYGALVGIESISRSAVFVFVGLCIIIAVIIFTSKSNADVHNITYAPKTKRMGLIEFFIKGIGYNSELCALAILMPKVKKHFVKVIYFYLVLKLIAIELIVYLCVAVLGAYVEICEFPFFKIGAYSKTQFVQRLDPLYMVGWTLCAVTTVSLFIYFITATVKKMSTKANNKIVSLIIAVLLIVTTVYVNIDKNIYGIWFDKAIGSMFLVVFVFIIPLFLAIVSKKKRKEGV